MRAALMLVQRLCADAARNGEGYLALNGRGAIQAGDWQKRVEGIRDRLLSETGSGYGKGALTRRLSAKFMLIQGKGRRKLRPLYVVSRWAVLSLPPSQAAGAFGPPPGKQEEKRTLPFLRRQGSLYAV